MDAGLAFTVLGARGSWPVSDPDMMEHGGHTTSFMISITDDLTVLVDAGTGLATVDDLDTSVGQEYHLFFTHFHIDHLQGLQFFKPLYREGNSFTMYGFPPEDMDLKGAIGGVFRAPWFPVTLADTPAQKRYVPFPGEPVRVGPLAITSSPLTHPQGAVAYRIEGPRATVVVATDHEAGDAEIDGALVSFAADADYLFHDGQYTPEEHIELYEGWGHSTWKDAVDIATKAGVGQLLLTSHDPGRTDESLDALIAEAQAAFPRTVAAKEGMRLPI